MEISGTIHAVLAPHAGYRYSGAIAANAYSLLGKHTPAVVAILGPYHEYDPAPILITPHSSYQTPLGDVPVALDALAEIDSALRSRFDLQLKPLHHDREHSLELQLPYLQVLFGDFLLLPLMVRTRNARLFATLMRAREQALSAGLKHVYTGNVHDIGGQSTYCTGCGELLIERDWYRLGAWNLNPEGVCLHCRTPLAGVFEAQPGDWGARRARVVDL